MKKKNEHDGYTCKCGIYHKYPAYVYAHSDVELVHSCECGRKNIIFGFVVEIGELPKGETNE